MIKLFRIGSASYNSKPKCKGRTSSYWQIMLLPLQVSMVLPRSQFSRVISVSLEVKEDRMGWCKEDLWMLARGTPRKAMLSEGSKRSGLIISKQFMEVQMGKWKMRKTNWSFQLRAQIIRDSQLPQKPSVNRKCLPWRMTSSAKTSWRKGIAPLLW